MKRALSQLDVLADNIAVLDAQGKIVFVNAAWQRFAQENGLDMEHAGLGINYLTVCDNASGEWSAEAPTAARGIRQIMQGVCGEFSLEYPCHSPSQRRWFMMTATPIAVNGESGVIVSHRDITQRKESEQAMKQACEKIQGDYERTAAENRFLRQRIFDHGNGSLIVAESEAMRRVLQTADRVAPLDTTVLLVGETGTGKELIAHRIHARSARAHQTMVITNCAALPAELIDNELFGHVKGAYTGASESGVGRFSLANGSTLFLDEIEDLPLASQGRLLRVLETGRFDRVGSPEPEKTDVRIIAATNSNLRDAVRDGTFRRDLFYRLNVFPIRVPALRERPGDIPVLVRAFVERFQHTMGKSIKRVRTRSIEGLLKYSWPGNVRELKNVVERAMIINTGPVLEIAAPSEPAGESPDGGFPTLDQVQAAHIRRALDQTGWRISGPEGAANLLGLPPTTLRSRMEKLRIERPGSNDDMSQE